MSNIDEKNLGPRWYVAHTYTGYENKVKVSIEKIVDNRGLGHLIYDVQVPVLTETVVNDKGEVIHCTFDFQCEPDGLARIPHFATCPYADYFRRR